LNKRLFRKWLRLGPRNYSVEKIKKQTGSRLDTPLSYSLVLFAKKAGVIHVPASKLSGAA
jgi:hypothetical protein